MRARTILVASLSLGLFPSGAICQRTALAKSGIVLTPPADWVAAPDSVVRTVNGMLAASTSHADLSGSQLVALLAPDAAGHWFDLPYITVRIDTFAGYRTRSAAIASLARDSRSIGQVAGTVRDAAVTRALLSSLDIRSWYIDSAAVRFWISARGRDMAGREAVTVSGSQFYQDGRIAVAVYVAPTDDLSTPARIVQSILDRLEIPSAIRFASSQLRPRPVPAPLNWNRVDSFKTVSVSGGDITLSIPAEWRALDVGTHSVLGGLIREQAREAPLPTDASVKPLFSAVNFISAPSASVTVVSTHAPPVTKDLAMRFTTTDWDLLANQSQAAIVATSTRGGYDVVFTGKGMRQVGGSKAVFNSFIQSDLRGPLVVEQYQFLGTGRVVSVTLSVRQSHIAHYGRQLDVIRNSLRVNR